MVRLVVFSEKFWPEGSGGELATYLILKLLASTGDFEIEVYTGTEKPSAIPGVSLKIAQFLKATNKVQLYLNILANRHYIERIIEKANVVYIPRFSYPVIPIARKHGKRVVVHLHDYQPVSYTAVVLSTEVDKPLSDIKRTVMIESMSGDKLRAVASAFTTPLTRVIRRWVNMADKIICVSKKHEEIILKYAPEYRGKTTVIYNPLPDVPNMEKKLSEKPTLLYVGGDSYVKGFHVLLEAFKILGKNQERNFKFILANRYNQRSSEIVTRLKRVYELDLQVVGRVGYEKLLSLHSQAWALVSPSIFEETFGYAVVEAMLLSTIPVASRVGAIPEIALGSPGERFLVEPNDPESLAVKIREVTSFNKEEVTAVGTELRESVLAKFNEDLIREKLAKIFYSLFPK